MRLTRKHLAVAAAFTLPCLNQTVFICGGMVDGQGLVRLERSVATYRGLLLTATASICPRAASFLMVATTAE